MTTPIGLTSPEWCQEQMSLSKKRNLEYIRSPHSKPYGGLVGWQCWWRWQYLRLPGHTARIYVQAPQSQSPSVFWHLIQHFPSTGKEKWGLERFSDFPKNTQQQARIHVRKHPAWVTDSLVWFPALIQLTGNAPSLGLSFLICKMG